MPASGSTPRRWMCAMRFLEQKAAMILGTVKAGVPRYVAARTHRKGAATAAINSDFACVQTG
jgi:hypothetical protein